MNKRSFLKKKTLLFFVLLSLSQVGYAFTLDENSIVENSIGKLLLLHDNKYSYQIDSNPFGSAEVYEEFLKVYNGRIKGLQETHRINFFWAGMWHLGFDGHYMVEFQKLIMRDCGKQFIARLQKYVENEKVLKRNRSRLYLSEKVLVGLKMIQERSTY